MELYLSLVLGGLSVSFFHAILPNHWLPFVLAGRAQRWSAARTLWIATLAGGGHVLITTLLGVGIVWMGIAVAAYVEAWSTPLASGILILFGAYYLVRHLRGGSHGHSHLPDPHARDRHRGNDGEEGAHGHPHHGHPHPHAHGEAHGHPPDEGAGSKGGDPHPPEERLWIPETVAVASLVAMLTFSPCEGFLPIYLTAMPYGWTAFAVLSGVLAIGTLAGMLLFTGLTIAGFRRVSMPWLERHEHLLLGGVLALMGVAVLAFHS